MRKYKVGLALSGGSVKGLAHLGVLKAFEENGIEINVMSGVSAGSLIAALYADGNSVDDILAFFKKAKFFDMVDFNFNIFKGKGGGLTAIRPFKEKLKKMMRSTTFEDLNIPIIVSATDLIEGKATYFSTGELIDPLIASSSVPLLFNPVRIDGKLYIDGGIMSNLAASVLRDDCEYLIGIHVNPVCRQEVTTGIASVSNRVFDLVINGSSTESEKAVCDFIINTEKACKYGMFGTDKADEIFKIGYEAAQDMLVNKGWAEKLKC